ncbi:MAG TPA: ABC transporter permease [Thermoplasmata archaeon]|nr:ABC transporter permease [Thermoplasmata archaeon]
MRYALDGVRRRPGRSALTALGIGLATGLVTVLLALSAGVQLSASRLATASGVDLIATSANTSLTSTTFPPLPNAHTVPGGFARADPNVATASPWLVTSFVFANSSLYEASNLSSNGSAIPGGWGPASAEAVGWIPGANAGLDAPAVASGPGFSSSGDPHYANGTYDGRSTHEVVLDQGLAGVLRAGVGGVVYVSAQPLPGPSNVHGWFANATAFRVVGISGPFFLIPSALLGFFYLSEAQTLLGGNAVSQDEASVVLVHLTDPSSPSADQRAIERAFPSLTVFTLANILGAVQSVVDLYRTFGTLIGLVGLIVAALFATTVLTMSVDDRSRELATLRAIGFARSTIGRYVVEEALVLAGLGLAVGLAGGYVGAYGLNRFLVGLLPGLPAGFSFVAFDGSVVASAVVEVLAIGLAAAILPTVQAMRLPIAEELRAP